LCLGPGYLFVAAYSINGFAEVVADVATNEENALFVFYVLLRILLELISISLGAKVIRLPFVFSR
jgi:hypothetical protein